MPEKSHFCFIVCVANVIINYSEGVKVYGKCLKFGSNETRPEVIDRDWYCLKDDASNAYCIDFMCPPTECDTPMTSIGQKCKYCPGTCTYGEMVYSVNDIFPCLDGSNSCMCLSDNRIASTKSGQHYQIMCGLWKTIQEWKQRRTLNS